jgi:hypothetical protein
MPVAMLSRPYNDVESWPHFARFASTIGLKLVFRPYPWTATYGGGPAAIHVELWSPTYFDKHGVAELGRAWEADELARWRQSADADQQRGFAFAS